MHVNTVSYGPCASCRIELVGPCEIDGCRWSPHRTVGHAYAIGRPLLIVDAKSHRGNRQIGDHVCVSGRLILAVVGDVETPLTAALAHCGPPESLGGRWASQLRVVGS